VTVRPLFQFENALRSYNRADFVVEPSVKWTIFVTILGGLAFLEAQYQPIESAASKKARLAPDFKNLCSARCEVSSESRGPRTGRGHRRLDSLSLDAVFTPLFIVFNIWELEAIEEPELLRRFGDEYEAYRRRTPMFIPRLRRSQE
jgi:hypothetical protein